MNETNIEESLGFTTQQQLKKRSQWLNEGSGWVIESVDEHYFNIIKYTPMKGSSYIQ